MENLPNFPHNDDLFWNRQYEAPAKAPNKCYVDYYVSFGVIDHLEFDSRVPMLIFKREHDAQVVDWGDVKR